MNYHGLPGISCDTVLSQVGQFFIISSISTFILTQYVDLHASNQVLSILMWFICNCFSALCCSNAGIINHLPFIALPSMIAISSLNDQYGCKSLFTQALVKDQPWSMSSDSILMCSSFSIDGNVHVWDFLIPFCFLVVFGWSVCD